MLQLHVHTSCTDNIYKASIKLETKCATFQLQHNTSVILVMQTLIVVILIQMIRLTGLTVGPLLPLF